MFWRRLKKETLMSIMPKLIIAGSRGFTDYNLLKWTLTEWEDVDCIIVSGGAKGADSLGELWARIHDKPIDRFLPDWKQYGKSAGYRRNADMAAHANHLCAFWDGKSKGTQHMITAATAMYGKERVNVVYYKPEVVSAPPALTE